MDWVSVKSRGLEGLKKYKYILVVILAGIFLMALPEKNTQTPQPVQTAAASEPNLQQSLSTLLSKIEGAGKVEVLLTQAEGSETLYQTDEDRSSGETTMERRQTTVLVTNNTREETGLIRQINPPAYQGAVVLCQGGDNARIRLAIVEAVANATGLTTDKITVLKMK